MPHTYSKEFGLLLEHFLGNEKAVLSPSAAAGLSGLPVGVARGAMQLLRTGGILRARGRGGLFVSDSMSESYRRSRRAYLVRR